MIFYNFSPEMRYLCTQEIHVALSAIFNDEALKASLREDNNLLKCMLRFCLINHYFLESEMF